MKRKHAEDLSPLTEDPNASTNLKKLKVDSEHDESAEKPFLLQYSTLACGQGFTIAVTKEGNLCGWGSNKCGQLGIGELLVLKVSPRLIPLRDPAQTTVRHVVTGSSHTIVMLANNRCYGWGYNKFGQVG